MLLRNINKMERCVQIDEQIVYSQSYLSRYTDSLHIELSLSRYTNSLHIKLSLQIYRVTEVKAEIQDEDGIRSVQPDGALSEPEPNQDNSIQEAQETPEGGKGGRRRIVLQKRGGYLVEKRIKRAGYVRELIDIRNARFVGKSSRYRASWEGMRVALTRARMWTTLASRECGRSASSSGSCTLRHVASSSAGSGILTTSATRCASSRKSFDRRQRQMTND